ncbi:MAG TPA: Xaa-Pro peptidase family protein [Alphaproteobacteria bacterium]|nr:Xaa-Pro peptidase family protein [Alphaproteobacteria bacterium]
MAGPEADIAARNGGRAVAPLDVDVAGSLSRIDQKKLRAYRLERLRSELRKRDYMGALLTDPLNIRYATGSRNMQVWTMHSPGRWAFVLTEGPVVLYEFPSSMHVNEGIETIAEMRPTIPWFFFLAGPRCEEKATLWADEVVSLIDRHGGRNRRLAVDRCEPMGAFKLAARGIELFDAQEPIEMARVIKSPEEIAALRLSMAVCDAAISRMRAAIRPGITENQLWAVLHDVNIAHDGEWIESRLLTSGERTNPWFQECGNRVIEAGDVVAFDTDMVGPLGYLADISRSWICPGKPPSNEQRRLYGLAQEQVLHNMSLLKPGLGFREFAEICWPVPEEFLANRYMMMVHGVGLVDEYPSIAYARDFKDWGYDGVFQENMVVSVESFIGEVGGKEGIKLEQQVLITASGAIPLSQTPFEDAIIV